MYIEIRLRNGNEHRVPIPEGASLNDEVDALLRQTGRFEHGWVPISDDPLPEHVRYDEIVSIRGIPV